MQDNSQSDQAPGQAEKKNQLTPQRLFSDPPLGGNAPQNIRFSPDGSFVTFTAVALDDRERMDLWYITWPAPSSTSGSAEEPQAPSPQVLLDARNIGTTGKDIAKLSAAERAERERRRQFNHGITQYGWHPDGKHLFVPIDGQAYLCSGFNPNKRSNVPGTSEVSATNIFTQPLCPEGTRNSSFQLSPLGHQLSYVRDGNLFISSFVTENDSQRRGDRDPNNGLQIESIQEQQLTFDAIDSSTEKITNGLPDLLAAEEMHRFEGHWWSTDGRYLAYCKVDESAVEISHRLELDAAAARTVEQRYPGAGSQNPTTYLYLIDLETGGEHKIWQSSESAEYLARVYPIDGGFLLQSQDRLQQNLYLDEYLFARDVRAETFTESLSGNQTWPHLRRRYMEQADTWINLTDNLHVRNDGNIVLTSESSGRGQIGVLDNNDRLHQLRCPTHVNSILGLDDEYVYATGWQDTATENHLFKIDLAGGPYEQLSAQPGWHEFSLSLDNLLYIDRWSNETTPLRVDLCNTNDDESSTLYVETFDTAHPYAKFIDQHSTAILGTTPAVDGQLLDYRLTPPTHINGKHPVIVYVYGGPGAQMVKRDWGALVVQMFAHHGFAVLQVDNRGATNRGRIFESPIYRQMGHHEVIDQVSGLDILSNYPWIDRSQVGVYGHSYGGYMSLLCLCHAGEHFKAGAAVAPVSDWALYDSHYTERYMGLPQDNPDGYKQSNVLTHLHKLNNPLLLMHGMADDNVLFTHSTMIMSELQQRHQPFELMTYPGAKHSMQESSVSIHRFSMIIDFFRRTLGEG